MTDNLERDKQLATQPGSSSVPDSNLLVDDTTPGNTSGNPQNVWNNNYTAINQIIQEQNLNEDDGDEEQYYEADVQHNLNWN